MFVDVLTSLPDDQSQVRFISSVFPSVVVEGVYFSEGQFFLVNSSGLKITASLILEWEYQIL